MRALPQTLSGTPDRDTASTGDRRDTGRTLYQSTDPEWLKEERQTAAASRQMTTTMIRVGIIVSLVIHGSRIILDHLETPHLTSLREDGEEAEMGHQAGRQAVEAVMEEVLLHPPQR